MGFHAMTCSTPRSHSRIVEQARGRRQRDDGGRWSQAERLRGIDRAILITRSMQRRAEDRRAHSAGATIPCRACRLASACQRIERLLSCIGRRLDRPYAKRLTATSSTGRARMTTPLLRATARQTSFAPVSQAIAATFT